MAAQDGPVNDLVGPAAAADAHRRLYASLAGEEEPDGDDLHQRVVRTLSPWTLSLHPLPSGQRWTFRTEVADGEDGMTTISVTATPGPVHSVPEAESGQEWAARGV